MSLSGMTGFARREGALGGWSWATEARSVNGRNLEVRYRGPPGFDSLERSAREAAQARFQRGQVNIGLLVKHTEVSATVRINQPVLQHYMDIIGPLVADGRAAPPTADGLLALRGVIEAGEDTDSAEDRAETEAAIAATIADVLDGLKASRLDEGRALTPVLSGVLGRIESLVTAAESEAASQPAAIKERYARRIAELIGQNLSEDRIAQEAAALAVKADVREELDRLTAHIAAARTLLGGQGASGRRLDFLTQEFMREANTLCSKSASGSLTSTGLELKAAIEQFREQVQNVE